MRIALCSRWLVLLAVLLFSGTAVAGQRVALVIGNSDYQHVARLPNPIADAGAVADLLSKVGFDRVVRRKDLGVAAFRHALREFAELSRGADMAVVFYAGHGMEIDGANYLIPIDATLKTDLDVEDETVSLDRVLRSLEAVRTRLVILDACRDNPFVPRMSRLAATRSVGRGLARVEPGSSDMLIAFAAKAGSIAADGAAGHSPFTAALVKHLAEPGLDVRIALGKVRDDVLAQTHGRQEPFVYGSLGGSTVAIDPMPETGPVAASKADRTAEIRTDYELAEHVGTMKAWDLFLQRYPSGFYADLARVQQKKLTATAAANKPEPAASIVVAAAERQSKPENGGGAMTKAPLPALQGSDAQSEPDLVIIGEKQVKQAMPPSPPPAAEKLPKTPSKAPEQKSASLTVLPAIEAETSSGEKHKSVVIEAIRSLQRELKRVGCDPGGDLGIWGAESKRALERFNRYAGTKLMVNVASIAALETIKAKQGRVCPLVCKAGFYAEGDRCVRGHRQGSAEHR